jgi:hypothetical protein
MCIVAGINLFTAGFLGEMILRNLYESGEKKSYYIREIHGARQDENGSKANLSST